MNLTRPCAFACLVAAAVSSAAVADVSIAKSSADFPTPFGGNVVGPLAKLGFNLLGASGDDPQDVPFPRDRADTSINAFASASWYSLSNGWTVNESHDPGPAGGDYRTSWIYNPDMNPNVYGSVSAFRRHTKPGSTSPDGRADGKVSGSNNNGKFRITPAFSTTAEAGFNSRSIALIRSITRDVRLPRRDNFAGPYRQAFNLDLIPAMEEDPSGQSIIMAYTNDDDGSATASRQFTITTNVPGYSLLFNLTISVEADSDGATPTATWTSSNASIAAAAPTIRFLDLGEGRFAIDPRDRFVNVVMPVPEGVDLSIDFGVNTSATAVIPAPSALVMMGIGALTASRRRRAQRCLA